MKLEHDLWNKEKIKAFEEYLYTLKRDDKLDFTKNTVNTKMDLLAISCPDCKKIAKEIFKGNYESFLDLMPHKYYEETLVEAYLIGLIKDFKMQKKYILKLSKYIDNWATVDSIIYNIKGYEEDYFSFATKLISSGETFKRRIGIRIMFCYKNNLDYLDKVFESLTLLDNEEEYYVNMAAAWLLCELFIHQKDKTFNYMKKNKNNKFIINKAISKCRDSFRVSKLDKEELLKLKIK